MTEKLNIKQLKPVSTDVNLGNSDVLLPTQKAVKDYVDTTASGLQSEIDALKGLGRFLSVWNCATGLAETNPPESPYTYNTGDYFLVGTVDSTTNYKPDGSSYTTGVASTTVETDTVKVNDVYIYDGTTWKLQANVQRDVVFSAIQGDPYDNTALSNALNAKQDTLTAGTNINITGTTISATDTTYTGSDGITLTGTNFTNSGVRSVASGTANGTISVNTNGTSADVSVTGLGSAAYTASSAYDVSGAASTAETNAKNYADGLAVNYATAAQGALADTALQSGDNVSALVNDAGYLTAHQTLTDLGITATAAEINVLDGITASTTELNYVDGVTSAIQTQIDGKQATISDLTTIRSGAAAGATAVQPGDLATVATSGSYTDLSNTPTIGNATLTIQKNSTTIDTFTANATSNKTIDISVPTKVSDLTNDSGFQTSADVSSAISTHNGSSSAHSSLFSAITDKIPAEATSTNKLADKAFVNSSISTNTAEFKGTYNTLADLEAVTADNNDYGFVVSTDSAGNTIYNRYKYNGTAWVFEYALNNSSFTATQWSAINSGATTTNIGQIATNTTNISNHVGNTSNPHNVTKAQVGLGNVDNTSDANKPVSTATQTALNAKANSADLATVATSGLYSDLTGTPSLATVATSGDYDDLINKPTIPAAQVNSDWNANSGVAQILNKPTLGTAAAADTTDFATATQGGKADTAVQPGDLATVATSGSYTDLNNKPTIPTTLAGLTGDVSISSPTDGQSLIYDGNTSKWKNVSASVSVGFSAITGSPYDNTALANELNNIDCGTMS